LEPPFDFACRRCGNCCRAGHGRVWFEPEELPAMAAARGMEEQAFAALHVTRVGERLSLREGPHGRCSLLEGLNECSVYEARPEQCRSFPYWPAILEGGPALERAAAYCRDLRPRPPASGPSPSA